MLIDVAISAERNVIKKEAEKILKYKDLTIEIQRMWNVKTKVNGTISKSFRKYVSNIPGKHEVKGLQKTAIQKPPRNKVMGTKGRHKNEIPGNHARQQNGLVSPHTIPRK